MYVLQPIFGVLQPFFGREAENRLDLRADVIPATGNAGLGDITDRSDLLYDHSIFDFRLGSRVLGFSPFSQVTAQRYYAAFRQSRDRQFHGYALSSRAGDIDHS